MKPIYIFNQTRHIHIYIQVLESRVQLVVPVLLAALEALEILVPLEILAQRGQLVILAALEALEILVPLEILAQREQLVILDALEAQEILETLVQLEPLEPLALRAH